MFKPLSLQSDWNLLRKVSIEYTCIQYMYPLIMSRSTQVAQCQRSMIWAGREYCGACTCATCLLCVSTRLRQYFWEYWKSFGDKLFASSKKIGTPYLLRCFERVSVDYVPWSSDHCWPAEPSIPDLSLEAVDMPEAVDIICNIFLLCEYPGLSFPSYHRHSKKGENMPWKWWSI